MENGKLFRATLNQNINSKCLEVWQSWGLSNVSRFHYNLYLYEKHILGMLYLEK